MDWLNDVHWTDVVAYNYCTGLEAAIAHNAHRDPNWYNITAITAVLYGLLTLLLNFRVYFVLLKDRKKEFSSSFYVVWIVANIVDSCWWVTNQLKDHVGNAPMLHFVLEWISNYSVFGRLFTTCWYFLLAYFMFADMLITVLVTLNRFVAVIFKHEDSMWKIVFPIGLLIVILLPILFTYKIWYHWVVLCSFVNYGQLYYYMNQILDGPGDGIQLDFGEFIVSFSCAIINAALNLTTIISVVRQRKKFSHSHTSLRNASSHIKGPELKMLIISCIMFINQFCYSLIHLIFFISKLTPAVQFLVDPCVEVRRFFIDFICLSPSWFLIIMIKSVRKRILPGMTERKKGKITTVVSTKTSTIVTVNSAKSY